jgi:hypothetical protein
MSRVKKLPDEGDKWRANFVPVYDSDDTLSEAAQAGDSNGIDVDGGDNSNRDDLVSSLLDSRLLALGSGSGAASTGSLSARARVRGDDASEEECTTNFWDIFDSGSFSGNSRAELLKVVSADKCDAVAAIISQIASSHMGIYGVFAPIHVERRSSSVTSSTLLGGASLATTTNPLAAARPRSSDASSDLASKTPFFQPVAPSPYHGIEEEEEETAFVTAKLMRLSLLLPPPPL